MELSASSSTSASSAHQHPRQHSSLRVRTYWHTYRQGSANGFATILPERTTQSSARQPTETRTAHGRRNTTPPR
eukprot:6042204-Pleurochrysis_carterae.AAC.1